MKEETKIGKTHVTVVTRPCGTCENIKKDGGFGPRHDGSTLCESGSIASGGERSHCSCDTCF